MAQHTEIAKRTFKPGWNSLAYGIFTLMGIFHWLLNRDSDMAVTYLGSALIFDPFDQRVKWENRPAYQKVVLTSHLLIFFAAFIYMLVAGK